MAKHNSKVAADEKKVFYVNALRALQFVEARSNTQRRFGNEADAKWAAFRGNLATADRIDLLIRDADIEWLGAFGARTVFGLRAVAEDDPFGSEWDPLDRVVAEELWREVVAQEPATDLVGALEDCAVRWNVSISPTDVEAVGPADRIVVAGASAVVAVARKFAEEEDLDWGVQVCCVAATPVTRQLAAQVSALLNTTLPTQFLELENPETKDLSGYRVVASEDVSPEERELLERFTER